MATSLTITVTLKDGPDDLVDEAEHKFTGVTNETSKEEVMALLSGFYGALCSIASHALGPVEAKNLSSEMNQLIDEDTWITHTRISYLTKSQMEEYTKRARLFLYGKNEGPTGATRL